MKYEYTLCKRDDDDVVAMFETDEPVPGIHPGHHLLVESGQHSTKIGTHLTIRAVETYLFVPKDRLERCRIKAFLDEAEREL